MQYLLVRFFFCIQFALFELSWHLLNDIGVVSVAGTPTLNRNQMQNVTTIALRALCNHCAHVH